MVLLILLLLMLLQLLATLTMQLLALLLLKLLTVMPPVYLLPPSPSLSNAASSSKARPCGRFSTVGGPAL